ncbi:MAG: hypothetical protein AB1679_29440 [Actinomycetota bacterium]|jgi:hypothetical protein
MIRRIAAGAFVLSALAVVVPPADAADSWTVCSIAGSVAPTPGVAYAPQEGKYDLKGTMDCTSDNPSHGEVTGTGTGTVGCLGGSSTATLTVAWEGGKTSTMKVQIGDFTYGTGGHGTVEDGEFKGSHVMLGWGRQAAGAEMRCATGGVKSYQFAGGLGIG